MIKFKILFLFQVIKNHIKAKAKEKWYYNYVPVKAAEGFTLAEVLITLLIIGVVASLVIPNLINETNDAELHTAWRKNYAEISAAFNRAKMDNGGTLLGACADDDNNCLRNLVIPYLSYTKSCDESNTNGANECIYKTNNSSLNVYSGIKFTTYWPNVAALKLINGAIIFFGNADLACDYYPNNSNIKVCGWFKIDINGYKGPNTVGKDFYYGWITPNGILPVGAYDQDNSLATLYNSASCDKSNPTAQGWGCSAKFLSQ